MLIVLKAAFWLLCAFWAIELTWLGWHVWRFRLWSLQGEDKK